MLLMSCHSYIHWIVGVALMMSCDKLFGVSCLPLCFKDPSISLCLEALEYTTHMILGDCFCPISLLSLTFQTSLLCLSRLTSWWIVAINVGTFHWLMVRTINCSCLFLSPAHWNCSCLFFILSLLFGSFSLACFFGCLWQSLVRSLARHRNRSTLFTVATILFAFWLTFSSLNHHIQSVLFMTGTTILGLCPIFCSLSCFFPDFSVVNCCVATFWTYFCSLLFLTILSLTFFQSNVCLPSTWWLFSPWLGGFCYASVIFDSLMAFISMMEWVSLSDLMAFHCLHLVANSSFGLVDWWTVPLVMTDLLVLSLRSSADTLGWSVCGWGRTTMTDRDSVRVA